MISWPPVTIRRSLCSNGSAARENFKELTFKSESVTRCRAWSSMTAVEAEAAPQNLGRYVGLMANLSLTTSTSMPESRRSDCTVACEHPISIWLPRSRTIVRLWSTSTTRSSPVQVPSGPCASGTPRQTAETIGHALWVRIRTVHDIPKPFLCRFSRISQASLDDSCYCG